LWQRSGSGTDLLTTYLRGSAQEHQWVSDFLAEEWQQHRFLHRLRQRFHRVTVVGKCCHGRGLNESITDLCTTYTRDFTQEQQRVSAVMVVEWERQEHRSLHCLLQRFNVETAVGKCCHGRGSKAVQISSLPKPEVPPK
jgi:hypothetical protein